MQAQDVISLWRRFLAEPFTTRWDDPTALDFYNQAQSDVARETRYLEARKSILTVPPNQEYKLPNIVSIRRVYMVGPGFVQRLPRSSIPLLEGDQIRYYDNTAANYTPQWLTIPSSTYPVTSPIAGIGTRGLPMFPGRRPEYYRRGGNIGLTYPPLSVYNLVIDVFDMPEIATRDTDDSPFPWDWRKVIAWDMCAFAYFSDQALDMEAAAKKNYQDALGEQQSFLSNLEEEDAQGPEILTHRSFYAAPVTAGWDGDW